jgi:hypothetical protein
VRRRSLRRHELDEVAVEILDEGHPPARLRRRAASRRGPAGQLERQVAEGEPDVMGRDPVRHQDNPIRFAAVPPRIARWSSYAAGAAGSIWGHLTEHGGGLTDAIVLRRLAGTEASARAGVAVS